MAVKKKASYDCECGKKLTTLDKYWKHYNAHKVKCDICGKLFNRGYLSKHKQRHVREDERKAKDFHICEVCGEKFKFYNKYREHVIIHDGHKCDSCQKSFLNAKALKNHQDIGVCKSHTCPECGKICPTGRNFRHHFNSHIKVTCDTCKKEISANRIKAHQKSHLPKGPKKYTCSFCKKEFQVYSSYRYHVSRHNINQCNVCSKICVSVAALEYHKRSHSKDTGNEKTCYTCEICKRNYFDLVQYEQHKKTHVSVECDICGRSFPTQYGLTLHRKSHVSVYARRKRDLVCAKCGKQFQHMSTYYNHVDRNNIHHCDICGKTCLTKTTLANHKKTHLGPTEREFKEYTCRVCDKKYKDYQSYWEHINTHEEHKCDICFRTYSSKSNLRAHQKKHSKTDKQKKEITCQVCQRKFRFRSIFIKHWRTHRKTDLDKRDPIKCVGCADSICEDLYYDRDLLEFHKTYVCGNQNVRKCSNCNLAFCYPDPYDVHVNNHCAKDQVELAIQTLTHNRRSDKKSDAVKCFDCGEPFFDYCILEFHKEFTCAKKAQC